VRTALALLGDTGGSKVCTFALTIVRPDGSLLEQLGPK
jgi:hypothetical protein